MSTVSKNPFDLLNEEDDDGVEKQPQAAKPAAAAPKKEVKPEVKKTPADSGKPSAAPPASGASKEGPKPQGERRPPKREFERHSGTGRGRRADGAEDKRGGSGKYNWGSKDPGTTLNDETGESAEAPREMTEEEKAAAEAAAEAKRKEEEQMTLDEYLKLKQAEKDAKETLQVRKVEVADLKGLKIKEVAKEETVWTIGDGD